jgi:hypothetical protein
MLLLSFTRSINCTTKIVFANHFQEHLNVTSYCTERLCVIKMCGVKLRYTALLQCCDELEQMWWIIVLVLYVATSGLTAWHIITI